MPVVAGNKERFVFGPFELDAGTRRLTRDGDIIPISSRLFDILHVFAAHPGQVLTKDRLIQAAWADVAVTDNSIEQAISSLRRTLGAHDGRGFIETHARRGYSFAVDVQRLAPARESDESLDALLAPHRAWIEGRAALETLEREQVLHARVVFERVLAQMPGQASAHVGLANACVMQFEMTRSEPRPDAGLLATGLEHAREACRLDAGYGEAWATLGFVLDRTGHHDEALAAGRRAIALESDNWRHHLRLAYVSWGEERLRGAHRVLSLLPGFPLAHWLAATVHVARQAFGDASRELTAGIAGDVDTASGRFSSVALHWLTGLLALARGDEPAAMAAFERELATEASGHLYARECAANTWYAIGATHLRGGRAGEARQAFDQATARVEGHVMANVGAALAGGAASSAAPAVMPVSADQMLALAAHLVAADRRTEAVALIDRGLSLAPAGSLGWLLPVEPLLGIAADPGAWAPVLARLRMRAA